MCVVMSEVCIFDFWCVCVCGYVLGDGVVCVCVCVCVYVCGDGDVCVVHGASEWKWLHTQACLGSSS